MNTEATIPHRLHHYGFSQPGVARRGAQSDDAILTALLVVQALMQFVAIPYTATQPNGLALLDGGSFLFAALCAVALTHRKVLRGALLGLLLLGTIAPLALDRLGMRPGTGPSAEHESIAALLFSFSVLVTAAVARRVFASGRVTAHRVQGAVLVYLNVAALFAVAYGLLEAHLTGAIQLAAGGTIPSAAGARSAELWYFSVSTITTTGFGDLIPVHPFARSLANLEAVFGQLFPAIFVARLVALHLAHGSRAGEESW